MAISKPCPSCTKMTSIPTREGVPLPDQRCQHCGFRLPNIAQGPIMKSSDYGD